MCRNIVQVCLVVGLLVPLAAHSQDTTNGIVWYPAIQLSDTLTNSFQPTIALSGDDTVHVTWWGGSKRLPYARSLDGGRSFEPTRELLVDSSISPLFAFRPFALALHENVYVLFVNPDPPDFGSVVHMFHSTDVGATFGTAQSISPCVGSEVTWASMSRDTIALIYPPICGSGFRKLLRSIDGGLSWTQTPEDLQIFTRISLTPGALHLVQQRILPYADEVEYKRSTDVGTTWEVDTLLSTNDSIWSDIPTVAGCASKCGTELVVAWRDLKYGGTGFTGASIICRAGLSNGQIWLPESLMTPYPTGTEPRIALNGSVRAVSWWDEVPRLELVFDGTVRASNHSLLDFSPPKNLAPPGAHGGSPTALAVSSHAIHVVYEQKFYGPPDTFRVFYRRGEFIPSKAVFSVSTGLLQFDTTEINMTRSDTVDVSNTGADSLKIGSAISDNSNFSVAPASLSIASGTNAIFSVRYTPTTFGSHSGKIIFYHNAEGSPDCFAVSGTSKWNHESVIYQTPTKWALVSIPVQPGPVQTLPHLYSYDGGTYVKRDTLMFGCGYWAKPSDSLFTFTGVRLSSNSIQLTEGWNLIGSVSVPIAVSSIQTIPDSIISASIYGWSGGRSYQVADTIRPGGAYWVKVNQVGTVKLSLSGSLPRSSRLAILSNGDLPPPPPGELQGSTDASPKEISLEQNYPNPFNPSTTIKYQLPADNYVSLTVHDIFGRVVATLVNGRQTAGRKSSVWNASSLPSGIYFYRLTVGKYVVTKKLLLIR